MQRRSKETPDFYQTDFLRICDSIHDRALTQRLVQKRPKLIDLYKIVFENPGFKTYYSEFSQ